MKSKKQNLEIEQKISLLPHLPGVYIFKNSKNDFLYIGKAIDLKKRVYQYFAKSKNHHPRILVMIKQIANIETIITKNEIEALILEANLIKKHDPRYNVMLRDGKMYPYIEITNEPFPRVLVTRRLENKNSKYFGPYTDVFNLRSALKTVRDIFKIRSCNYFIDQKTIDEKKIKLCLDFQINKCDGPCEGLISEKKYNEMIENVERVLKGKISIVRDELEKEMKSLANKRLYEDAKILRDKILELDVYTNKQKVMDLDLVDRDVFSFSKIENDACVVVLKIREGKLIGKRDFYLNNISATEDNEILESVIYKYYSTQPEIPSEVFLPIKINSENAIAEFLSELRKNVVKIVIPKKGDKTLLLKLAEQNSKILLNDYLFSKIKKKEVVPHVLKSLERDLNLKKIPNRIECFDISHFQGSDTVASMILFEKGKPKKSEYRKFKINSLIENKVDDFQSMKEVIHRRYKRVLEENLTLPDLIVIDGGKGQLSSAISSLEGLNLNHIPIISLAKKLEEIYFPNQSEPFILPKSSSSLKLLQQIRNEAHRFAISFHKTLRDKSTFKTELTKIAGIGIKQAQKLISHFGSISFIKSADENELAKIVGNKNSQKIKNYFLNQKDIEL